MLIFDTDVIPLLRRTARFPELAAWNARQDERAAFISAVSIGEVERSIVRQRPKNPVFAAELAEWSARLERSFRDRIIPFGVAEAKIWGELCGRLGYVSIDLMIAATAIVRGATVVTRNERDFARTGVSMVVPF